MTKGEIFSQRFIPSLLDGTKVRTSRPIKPQPTNPYWCGIGHGWDDGHGYEIKPKYRPGDIMYVRETWQSFFPEEVTEHHQQGARSFSGIPAETAKGHYMYFYYRADGEVPPDPKYGKANWCPSIHMPREAARIFLRVTDVKVQHIDTLTEQDAVEDGFMPNHGLSASGKFESFWLAKYGLDCPWMWVYYFERISKEEATDDR